MLLCIGVYWRGIGDWRGIVKYWRCIGGVLECFGGNLGSRPPPFRVRFYYAHA